REPLLNWRNWGSDNPHNASRRLTGPAAWQHRIKDDLMISANSTGGKYATGVLDTAFAYRRVGLSVIPIRPDGSKAPSLPAWRGSHHRPPTTDELRRWFDDGRNGIPVLCGAVSGSLELLDFDARADQLFPAWSELVEAEAPGLIPRLCVVR